MRNYKNTSFNTAVLLYGVLKPFVLYKYFVIAVRVSGGHLCEAEAPTEPAGETAVRCAAIRTPPVIARGFSPVAIRFLLKGITDSFTPRAQNDKPFSYFNHRKIRGNPFSPPRNNNLKNYSFFISQFLIAYSKSTFINSFLERFVSDEI